MVWRVLRFGRLRSTQDRALRAATKGAPEGTVVVAREQTAGRGRQERRWVSPRGGLYMSVLLRPQRKGRPESIQFLGALAAIDGIRKVSGVACTLRWPNDVVAGGKKVGGVIAEASFMDGSLSHVALGVGVNCNFEPRLLGGVGADSAALMGLAGAEVDIDSLVTATLESLAELYAAWSRGEDRTIDSRIRESLSTLGRRVSVKLPSGEVSGVAESFGSDGSLVVRTRRKRMVIRTEDMEWLRES